MRTILAILLFCSAASAEQKILPGACWYLDSLNDAGTQAYVRGYGDCPREGRIISAADGKTIRTIEDFSVISPAFTNSLRVISMPGPNGPVSCTRPNCGPPPPPQSKVRFATAQGSTEEDLPGFFQPIGYINEEIVLLKPGFNGSAGYVLFNVRTRARMGAANVSSWNAFTNPARTVFAAISERGMTIVDLATMQEKMTIGIPQNPPPLSTWFEAGFLENDRYAAMIGEVDGTRSPRIAFFDLEARKLIQFRRYDNNIHRYFFVIEGTLFSQSPGRIIFQWSAQKGEPVSYKEMRFSASNIQSRGGTTVYQSQNGIYSAPTKEFLAMIQSGSNP